ncbi:MAG: hypothetical protein IJR83_04230 [Clostridia bacterium]|nr:hypothetical protein [Clostridia bacterium]
MKLWYRRNQLYFYRIDYLLLLAMVLSDLSAMLLIIFNYGEHKAGVVFAIVMLVILGIIALIVAAVLGKKDTLVTSINEARRLLTEELASAYGIAEEQDGKRMVFLVALPPPRRRHMKRGGFSSFYYLLGCVRQENRVILDIRGMSLITPARFQKRLRVSLDEISEIRTAFDPPRRKKKKIQVIEILGLDGEIRFCVRCRPGHDAEDFIRFVREQDKG